MVSYSAWVWSAEQNRHFCCSYDEQGNLIQYHWSGIADTPEVQAYTTPVVNQNEPPPIAQARPSPQNYVLPTSHDDTGSFINQSVPQPSDQPRWTQPIQTISTSFIASYSSPESYTYQTPTLVPADVQETVKGNKPSRHIKTDNDGETHESLDPRYARVTGRHIPFFFVRGRVFKMLWTEPAGLTSLGQTRGSTHFSVVQYGEMAYTEIRRFVVVSNKGTFSQCIPIQTYRGKGATKPGLLVQDHGMVYTGYTPPQLLYGEGITKYPIRVQAKDGQTLDPESRINFGKPYAVEHNVKVMEIGMVAPEHMHLLQTYFENALSS